MKLRLAMLSQRLGPEPWESVRPLQGPKSPTSGKEGFGVEKPQIRPNPQKGRLKSENPHLYTGHHREIGIFGLKARFSGVGGFSTPKPSFPDFGDLTPVRGGRIRN